MSARVTSFFSESSIPVVYLFIAALCVGAYVVLQPRVAGIVFPQARADRMEKFISQIKSAGHIDPVLFWELRDLYSPGFMKYNAELIMPYSILQFSKPYTGATEVFSFSGTDVQSTEVVQRSTLPQIGLKPIEENSDTEIIIATSSELAYIDHKTETLVITFSRPVSEFKKYNGLLNYDDEALYLKNTHMITGARITIP